MEEADQILIFNLRQIGCPIPDEFVSIKEFTSEEVVASVAACVNLITNGESNFPVKLPANVAVRHRTCTLLANTVKELGYPGETGYNQLLYPNEKDTRRVLQFLVGKIPKADEERGGDVVDASGSSLNRDIATALPRPGSVVTLQKSVHAVASVPVELPTLALDAPAAARAHAASYLPFVWSQVPHASELAPSVLERNVCGVVVAAEREAAWGSGLDHEQASPAEKQAALNAQARRAFAGFSLKPIAMKSSLEDVVSSMNDGSGTPSARVSTFTHMKEFGQEQMAVAVEGASAVDDEAEREAELAALAATITRIETETKALSLESTSQTTQIRQVMASAATEKGKTEALEREYVVRTTTNEMLPDAARYIAELKEICAASAARLVTLAAEWETHRKPLLDSIRAIKDGHARRKERCKEMLEAINRMRTEMVGLMEQLRDKEERAKLLSAEFERMPKEVNRNVYTRRIIDIIKQIRKQKAEIGKIIADIRVVQREINFANEKLTRTVTIAEESMFKAASANSKDPAYIQGFRFMTQIREVFAQLIDIASQIGHAENECRDLESKCESLRQKTTERNMDKIKEDIRAVQAENATLMKQLASV